MPSGWQLYVSARARALGVIGFASGIPNTLLTDVVTAWLSSLGISPAKVGLTAFLRAPLALKVLWSPVIDLVTPPGFRWLDRRRAWILLTQLLLVGSILVLAAVAPRAATDALGPLFAVGLAIAVCSATLDMAADAYRTDISVARERTSAAAIFVAGYRVGMVLAGAVTLWFAESIGWPPAVAIGAALLLLSTFGTVFAPRGTTGVPPASLADIVVEPLRSLHLRHGRSLAAILLLAVLFKLPDQLGNQMTMTFLLEGMGFTTKEISVVRQALGIAITVVGSLAGGIVAFRLGLFRSLIVFGIAQAVSNLGFCLMAGQEKSMSLFVAVVVVENFAAGLVGAGFVAFLMSCCDRRHAGTQYALLTALMMAAGSVIPAISGVLVERLGFGVFFLLSAAAGIPGILLVILLKPSLSAIDVILPEPGETG